MEYPRAYPTFTRQIREAGCGRCARRACEAGSSKVPTTEIAHDLGEETQWDWVAGEPTATPSPPPLTSYSPLVLTSRGV